MALAGSCLESISHSTCLTWLHLHLLDLVFFSSLFRVAAGAASGGASAAGPGGPSSATGASDDSANAGGAGAGGVGSADVGPVLDHPSLNYLLPFLGLCSVHPLLVHCYFPFFSIGLERFALVVTCLHERRFLLGHNHLVIVIHIIKLYHPLVNCQYYQ